MIERALELAAALAGKSQQASSIGSTAAISVRRRRSGRN
jgi:hypothetical protein